MASAEEDAMTQDYGDQSPGKNSQSARPELEKSELHDSSSSITANAQLLAELAEVLPERSTVLSEIRAQLIELVGTYKLETERGSLARLFFNALLQDLHVMEEVLRAGPGVDSDERAWEQPLLETLLAKLSLGARLYPPGAGRFHAFSERLGRLRAGAREWATVRVLVGGLLSGPTRLELRPEARAVIDAGGQSALGLLREWSAESGGPPLFLAAIGQVIEGLGLHAALVEAEDPSEATPNEALRVTLEALGEWLMARGATAIDPAPDGAITGAERVVFRRLPSPGRPCGAIDRTVAKGFSMGAVRLARPTVLVNPGTGSRVLERALAVLSELDPDSRAPYESTVEALKRVLWHRFDDPEAEFTDCVEASLDIIEALREVGGGRSQPSLVRAFQADFEGTGLELIAPAPGTTARPDEAAELIPVCSARIAPGQVVAVRQYGLRLDETVLRSAKILVSHGPAPLDRLAPILEDLHPSSDEASRIVAALEARPADMGRQLALELIGLIDGQGPLAGALQTLCELDLQVLSELDGWSAMTQLFESEAAAWLSDGPAPRRAIRALLRPYRRAIESRESPPTVLLELRWSRLAAAIRAPLMPLPDNLRERLLAFALHELRSANLSPTLTRPWLVDDLLNAAATLLSSLWNADGAGQALERTVSSLQSLGIEVLPQLDGELSPCNDPEEAFARLDARYHDEIPRGQAYGPIYPALRWSGFVRPGFIRVSLGPRPPLSEWLKGRPARRSALGFATRRLVAEVSHLDRARLIAQLRGEAGADTRWRRDLTRLINEALEQCGVRDQDQGDEGLRELFEILKIEGLQS